MMAAPPWTATVAADPPSRNAPLEVRKHVWVARKALKLPVALERLEQSLQVAGGGRQVGLAHLDVVQANDGVDLDRVRVGLLAHDLAVHLALRRHVDDEVTGDLRVTSESAVGGQPAALAVARPRAR